MTNELVNTPVLVELQPVNGEAKPVTTSLRVAEYFGKEHKHVMRDIRETLAKCSESFNGSNFGLVDYVDPKGEKRPMYLLTRDGFTMVAMGYTGEKAMRFKEAYINAFNEMERKLSIESAQSAPALPDFTNPAEAARAWANEYEAKMQALEQVEALEVALGNARDWKTTTGIPWLNEYFADTSETACSRIGKILSALSRRDGVEIRKTPHTRYGAVNVYHVSVIAKLKEILDADANVLKDIRS